jgi:hypothetical protein
MNVALGQIVHYRGKQGLRAPRAAIVTATTDSLDPAGVESGGVPALDSDEHVHLWVFTPSVDGGFAEYNVARGESATEGEEPVVGTIPPGTWCPAPAPVAGLDVAELDAEPVAEPEATEPPAAEPNS